MFKLKSIVYACLALCSTLAACSKDQSNDIEDQEYTTVQLTTHAPLEDEARAVRFTIGDNDKPRFQFTNELGQVSGTRKVYTTITKGEGAQRTIIFEKELDWKIEDDGRKLSYTGEIKILSRDFRDATNLTLHAVTGQRTFNKTNSEKQTELLVHISNRVTNVEVPYSMTTAVKKVGQATLTLSEPDKARFKPKGVLTLFTIKNNLDVLIQPQMIMLYSPKYHRGIALDQYGELSLSDSREDTPLLYREGLLGIVPAKSKMTLIAWLPKEDLESITEVKMIGSGIQGPLTRTSNKAVSDGSLVTYEIELYAHKQPLDKGMAYTDNFGNVLPYFGIENGSFAGPLFSPDEVRTRNTSEDSWMMRYYFPMWYPAYSASQIFGSNRLYWNMVHTTKEPQNKNPEDYWRATPGTTNQSPFADWIILGRGQSLRYEYSKFCYRNDSPAPYMNNGTLYIARFVDNTEYRVLQRLRSIDWEDETRFRIASIKNNVVMEVSFLPYDEAAVADESAFTAAYWEERKQMVQTVRFGTHFAIRNLGPYHTEYNNMLVPDGDTGIPFWFNTMRNFEDAQTGDNFPISNQNDLCIPTFVDKLPARATAN